MNARQGRSAAVVPPQGSNRRFVGVLCVVGAALLWSTAGPIRRQVGLPAEVSAAARAGFGAVTMLVWFAVARWRAQAGSLANPLAPARAKPVRIFSTARPLIVLSGLAVVITWWCQYAAVDHLPVGAVYLIMYLSPVLVVVSARFMGEAISTRLLVGLGVAVLGVAAVAVSMFTGGTTWPEGGNRMLGLALAVGAAIGLAGLNVTTKMAVSRYDALQVPLQQFLVASTVLVPLGVSGAGRWPTAIEWGWLVTLGVVHSGFAVGLFSLGLRSVPVSQASVLAYAEPAGAVITAWVFLGEVPSALTALGGLLIVIGGIAAIGDALAVRGFPGTADAAGGASPTIEQS